MKELEEMKQAWKDMSQNIDSFLDKLSGAMKPEPKPKLSHGRYVCGRGEWYRFINEYGVVIATKWHDDRLDCDRLAYNNCYPANTDEAERVAMLRRLQVHQCEKRENYRTCWVIEYHACRFIVNPIVNHLDYGYQRLRGEVFNPDDEAKAREHCKIFNENLDILAGVE